METSLALSLPDDRLPTTVGTVTDATNAGHARDENLVSSAQLGWQGFHLIAGIRRGWPVDDSMNGGHHVFMNLGPGELCFQSCEESDWRSAQLAPLEFWIIPEGCAISVRNMSESRHAFCTVDGRYLDSLAGCHFELEAGIGIVDPVLARLIQALIAMIEDTARYSQALATEIIRAAVNALAARHGHPAAELKVKGGIAPSQMKSLLTWLKDHIEEEITVSVMAAQVGLSAAHFSREFKRSTGSTPWDYVVSMRLDRARDSLLNGGCFASVASQFGFADQSHMARLFKVRFGLSPSAFVKANK